MVHDYRMAKALQEQKLRDAQRIQEEEDVTEQTEKTFKEQVVARLVTLLHIRARKPGAAKSSEANGLTAV